MARTTDDSDLLHQRNPLFIPGLLVVALVCAGAGGYCLWQVRAERQEEAARAAAQEEAARLHAQRLDKASRVLAEARKVLETVIDTHFWPGRAEIETASARIGEAARIAADAPGLGGTRALVEGLRAVADDDLKTGEARLQQACTGADEALARFALGRLWLARGQLMEASASFVGALQARPDWPPARLFAAIADLALDRERQALPELQRAAARWPDSTLVLDALGRCLEKLPAGAGHTAAVGLLAGAVSRGVRDERVLEHWVTLADGTGQAAQVASALDQLLSAEPGSAPLHLARGRLLRSQGEAQPAMNAYVHALELEPGNRHVRLELAGLLLENGRARDCLTVVTPAAEFEPQDPEWKAYLGYAERQLGQVDQARDHFAQSCGGGFPWSCEEACDLGHTGSCERVPAGAGGEALGGALGHARAAELPAQARPTPRRGNGGYSAEPLHVAAYPTYPGYENRDSYSSGRVYVVSDDRDADGLQRVQNSDFFRSAQRYRPPSFHRSR